MFDYHYYPEDIVNALEKASYKKLSEMEKSDCINALDQLRAICQNPYNFDFYRTFYKLLETITDAS